MTMKRPRRRALLPMLLLFAACAADDDAPASGGASTTGSTTADAASTTTTTAGVEATTAAADASGESTAVATSEAPGDTTTTETTTGVPTEPGPDFREPGPYVVTTTSGEHTTAGCTQRYDVFTPDGPAAPPVVILAHGFQGNRASMAGWAEHWASWGLVVVTPDLCHATIIDVDHAQNGADLDALAEHLGGGSIALAGYSAGGLAAVVAAAARPTTPVLLGLDMVDSGGLGAQAAPAVAGPALDLTAETAMCNSSSNGIPVFAAMQDASVVRLVEADHCDFQSPPDGFCNLCAAPNDAVDPATIAATIRGMSAAALLWHLGVDATGAQWWTPGGPYFDALFGDGLIVAL